MKQLYHNYLIIIFILMIIYQHQDRTVFNSIQLMLIINLNFKIKKELV